MSVKSVSSYTNISNYKQNIFTEMLIYFKTIAVTTSLSFIHFYIITLLPVTPFGTSFTNMKLADIA